MTSDCLFVCVLLALTLLLVGERTTRTHLARARLFLVGNPLPGDGSLSSGGLEVRVNGLKVLPNALIEILTDQTYNITVEATGGTSLLGFLMRLGGGADDLDTTDVFGELYGAQVAAVCTPLDVGGICHTNNMPKEDRVGGGLTISTVSANLPLDVTVVSRNCGPQPPLTTESSVSSFCTPAESVYFHSVYNFTVIAPDSGAWSQNLMAAGLTTLGASVALSWLM
jgi:hypothetical protein